MKKETTKFENFYISLWGLLVAEVIIIAISFALIVFSAVTPWYQEVGDFFTKVIVLFGIVGLINVLWIFIASIIMLFTPSNK